MRGSPLWLCRDMDWLGLIERDRLGVCPPKDECGLHRLSNAKNSSLELSP